MESEPPHYYSHLAGMHGNVCSCFHVSFLYSRTGLRFFHRSSGSPAGPIPFPQHGQLCSGCGSFFHSVR